MTTKPFRNHPDSNLFFASKVHNGGWNFLIYGIQNKEPFLLVTGDYGAGKTVLCLRLLNALKNLSTPLPYVFIPIASYTYNDILRKITSSLNIPTQNSKDLQTTLFSFFEKKTLSYPVYIVIDDVHEFKPEVLDKLRFLANFNHQGQFPLKLIFFAHVSFLKKLQTGSLRALNQRIQRRYHLKPLNFYETKEYIFFRLLKSGAQGYPTFDINALQAIYNYSKGLPRLINNICDASLLCAASEELYEINTYIVDQARDYLGEKDEPEGASFSPLAQQYGQGGNHVTQQGFGPHAQQAPGPGLNNPGARPQDTRGQFGLSGHSPTPPSQAQGTEQDYGLSQDSPNPGNIPKPSKKKTNLIWLAIIFVVIFILGFIWRHEVIGNIFVKDINLPTISYQDKAPTTPKGQKTTDQQGSSPRDHSSYSQKIKNFEVYPMGDAGPGPQSRPKDIDIQLESAGQNMQEKVVRHYVSRTWPCAAQADRPYYLVLSSCRHRDSAIKVLQGLEGQGLSALSITPAKSGPGKTWWLVCHGNFKTRSAAEAVRQRLGRPDAMVKKAPFTNRLAVLTSTKKAKARYFRLRKQGLYPQLIQRDGVYWLCLGCFPDKDLAREQKEILTDRGLDPELVVR